MENDEGYQPDDIIDDLRMKVAQLEKQLAKVIACYNFVRDMTPEDFGNLSSINDEFDIKVDDLIKDRSK